MDLLVLDTIHGGRELAACLAARGHRVDTVDVYRGREGIGAGEAARRSYDRVIAPVHLDPDHQLLKGVHSLTHHEAVRMLLSGHAPTPMVEVTGAQGKTTTAHAIAHLMPGVGVLHTSRGTFRYPSRELLWRRSITPASVVPAAEHARSIGGWLVAEESLGVTGAGEVGVLTSAGDYPIAAGKCSALSAKVASLAASPRSLVPADLPFAPPRAVRLDMAADVEGDRCRYHLDGREGEFRNPLLRLPAYTNALAMAAAVGCMLGLSPDTLATFTPVEGRMHLSREGKVVVVDGASSGTTAETAVDAAGYARSVAGRDRLALVIGEEAHAVCEGFPPDQVRKAVRAIRPAVLVLVGRSVPEKEAILEGLDGFPGETVLAETMEEGRVAALSRIASGSVVLAVKSWR
ncbi:MAG: coenzyme F430 synthase [Methanomicrobiales archaeon]|nr:coenzyme F430 synthase [Methanomicrobiales archaeon]